MRGTSSMKSGNIHKDQTCVIKTSVLYFKFLQEFLRVNCGDGISQSIMSIIIYRLTSADIVNASQSKNVILS